MSVPGKRIMPSMENTTIAFARRLDSRNPLAGFRERFYLQPGVVYLDGNSLGLLSRDAEQSLLRVLEEWKKLAIGGWLKARRPWFWFAEQVGAMAAKLVGAEPGEVILTGTTTVNIHSLVSTFYNPGAGRYKIVADALNFPSDLYALQGQLKLRGQDPDRALILAQPGSDGLLGEDSLIELMDDETALVFLPSVLYRSGQLLDMEKLSRAANRRGIPIGFDCSHSVGAVPHEFDAWGVDFALWCSYKYLNGGPGAAAFLYVNKRHFSREPLLAGWFGCLKERQFEMLNEFIPAADAGRWQISSPGILGTSPVEGAIGVILEAGIGNIRRQSLALTSYLAELLQKKVVGSLPGCSILTPLEPERRGGHIALRLPEAVRISLALKAHGFVVDLRPPDIIRIAPVALYNSFEEVWLLVDALSLIIENREFAEYPPERGYIT